MPTATKRDIRPVRNATKTTAQSVVRAVSYCRISYDPTGHEAGVERQHVDTDRIAEQNGWTLVERVVDNDRSASRYARRAREGWARIMELVEGGHVEALVAYDLDRLIRQPKELERLIDAAESGLRVVTATGQIDLATGGGRMVARTLCNVAAMEADRTSERQRSKLRHDALAGRPHWVRRPFGYTLDGKLIADEAKWVRKMYRWIANDGMSATAVAIRLNAEGVAQATGKPWQSAGVKLFVTSPRNMGRRTYHGEDVATASWPGIVDEKLWKSACAALAARTDGTTNRGRRSMLTGMVRCAVCGATMQRTNSGPLAAWRCSKHRDVGTGCGQSINAVALDKHVADMVLVRIGEVRPATVAMATGVEEVDALRTQLAEMADLVGKGQLTMNEWKAVRGPLSERLAAAEARLTHADANAALSRLAGDSATLAQRWDTLNDVDLQRRLVSLVLDHVDVAVNTRRGPGTDLARITPIWK